MPGSDVSGNFSCERNIKPPQPLGTTGSFVLPSAMHRDQAFPIWCRSSIVTRKDYYPGCSVRPDMSSRRGLHPMDSEYFAATGKLTGGALRPNHDVHRLFVSVRAGYTTLLWRSRRSSSDVDSALWSWRYRRIHSVLSAVGMATKW